MDLRKIKKLIELVEESGISEIEVKNGDEAVRIARPVPPSQATVSTTPTSAVPLPPATVGDQSSITVIPAPISGTFYRATAPGEQAFVNPGDSVKVGDTLCIIESMKMMNQIESESAGEVVAVLVQNGDPVATGQALFQIR